jgi:type IV secretory pathway TraG/TraD family ATPase VirD4
MPSASRGWLPVVALALIGIAALSAGAAGAVREVASVLPVHPALAWMLRVCLAARRCRETSGALLARAIASHARVLWVGTLAVATGVVWGGILRFRSGRRSHAVDGGRVAGGAHFASRTDLRRLTRGSAGAWFPLGYAHGARAVRLPEEDLARHVCVIGRTGARKTTAVTFPVLIEAARAGVSVVAFDLKYGEQDSLARCAPAWRHQGRDVMVFAPLDPLSLRWNPLAGCRTMGDAQRLAAMLFDDVDETGADMVYWMGAERHVCASLCFALATDGGPPVLVRLRTLCEGGPVAVQTYAQAHPSAPALIARLGAYRAMLPKDQAGILQGIASRLEAWGDETVCRATDGGPPEDRIDLGRLRREPVLLIVGVPQPSLSQLRVLCHLFLKDLASCLLRPRGADERVHVLEVLEELPAWGPLPGLADHLATFRSRQVSVLATIQIDWMQYRMPHPPHGPSQGVLRGTAATSPVA